MLESGGLLLQLQAFLSGLLLLLRNEDFNAKDGSDFADDADDELAEDDGNDATDQSHTHLEVHIPIAEVADQHDCAHGEEQELHQVAVGLVPLLADLVGHDVVALVDRHKHVKQVVNRVVGLTVVKLISVEAGILWVHNWRVLDDDWVIALVSEHQPHRSPYIVDTPVLHQGPKLDWEILSWSWSVAVTVQRIYCVKSDELSAEASCQNQSLACGDPLYTVQAHPLRIIDRLRPKVVTHISRVHAC